MQNTRKFSLMLVSRENIIGKIFSFVIPYRDFHSISTGVTLEEIISGFK